MIDPQEFWALRPPFPDEEDRLRRHFASGNTPDRSGRALWRQVLVAGPRQRLVGLAELRSADPVSEPGETTHGPRLHLSCEIRPAWQNDEAARAILESACARARELGAVELDFVADPLTGLAQLVRDAGFAEIHRRERWKVPVAGALTWMRTRGDRLLEPRATPLVSTRDVPLGWVRDICLATHLLPAERVARHQPGWNHGFDDEFSFALPAADRLDAVILAREQSGKIYLEVLARHPSAKSAPLVTVIALIREFFRQAERHGHEEIYCEISPAKTPGILKAVVIGQGSPHSLLTIYRKRL